MRRLVLILPLFLAGCAQEPVVFNVNHPIPVGDYNLTVTGSDLHQFGEAFGHEAYLTVRFRLDPLNSEPDIRRFMGKVRFTLLDSEEKSYRCSPIPDFDLANPTQLLESIKKQADDPEGFLKELSSGYQRWQLLAKIPASAHGFRLRIRNRDTDSGQPRLASIDLMR